MGFKTATSLLLSTALWVNMGLTGSFLCWSCLESLTQMQLDGSWGWNVQDGFIPVAGILAERVARMGPPHSRFPLHVASLYGSWSQEQAFQEDKSLCANSYKAFTCIMPTRHHFPKLRFSVGRDNSKLWILGGVVHSGPPKLLLHWPLGAEQLLQRLPLCLFHYRNSKLRAKE